MGQDSNAGAISAQVPAAAPSLVSTRGIGLDFDPQQARVHVQDGNVLQPLFDDPWSASDSGLRSGSAHLLKTSTELGLCWAAHHRTTASTAEKDEIRCGHPSVGTKRGVN